MDNKKITVYQISMTYIGTVIGAGFASGQEILQFFVKFGIKGFYGILVSTIMFIIFGKIIMSFGKKLNSSSHQSIIRYVGGDVFGPLLDWSITIFLFMTLTAMIAGTGALLHQQFNLSYLWGNLLMTVITALTVISGIHGIILSISIAIPLLIISIIVIGAISFLTASPDLTFMIIDIGKSTFIENWALAALLYSAYNVTLSTAVLGPLGVEAKREKSIKWGAVWGGIGLGMGSLIIFFILFTDISGISNLEIPMIYIAGKISWQIKWLYCIVLIIAVYTTAVGNLFGISARFKEIKGLNFISGKAVLFTSIAAFVSGYFGFKNMVMYIYPLSGFIGIVFIGCIICKLITKN